MTKLSYKIGCNLRLKLPLKKLTLLHILKIKPLDYIFFMLLIHMSNVVSIGYYLLYDL